MRPPLATPQQIAAVVRDVEACRFPFPDWHHDIHLVVTSWYVERHECEEATRRMRETVLRYNAHNGIDVTRETGYHETLTVAWVRIIAAELNGLDTSLALPARVRHVLEACADKYRLRDHYSRERIMSWDARLGWVEPDLAPLP